MDKNEVLHSESLKIIFVWHNRKAVLTIHLVPASMQEMNINKMFSGLWLQKSRIYFYLQIDTDNATLPF